jgi:hypothetical protein
MTLKSNTLKYGMEVCFVLKGNLKLGWTPSVGGTMQKARPVTLACYNAGK